MTRSVSYFYENNGSAAPLLMNRNETKSDPLHGSDGAHIPVLRREVVEQFDFSRPAWVVDATLGLGGHAQALLQRYPALSVFGVEWDAEALQAARARLACFAPRFRSVEGSFVDLPHWLSHEGIENISGILMDLGVSSLQLDDASRGFSFAKRGPLDMRMSKALSDTAWEILRRCSETELAHLFQTYGEEPYATAVAKTVKAAITRGHLTNDCWKVAQCMRAALPPRRAGSHIDPATRCFQALRMTVNHELDNLQRFLNELPSLLPPGGRVVVLAFHSLEDRLVKQTFIQAAKGCVCPPQIPQCVCGKKPWGRLLTRKAIQATADEIKANPRARSVRMRVLEKL